jgi:8-amino-7-oxononanoate synthase
MNLDDVLQNRLNERTATGSLRSLRKTDSSLADFSSNDYLGLARSAELNSLIQQEGVHPQINGSTGSRLLTGNSTFTEQVEQELAVLFKTEAALIFNSGYAANLAVLSSLPKRGDTILYDERSHASIKDGMRLSLAARFPFRHNDVNDLEKKIRSVSGNVFVVAESVYSMDGDESPLQQLAALCHTHGTHLIIDEAHSTGCHGEGGSGLICELMLHHQVPVRIYTFGKAMGIHGACVAGSNTLLSYLINFARPFIYTTAPDPRSIAAIKSSFAFLDQHPWLQHELREKIDLFRVHTKGLSALLPSRSAIQSFIIPGNANVKNASQKLNEAGLDVRPILSPTVAKGTERLRIILHTYNTNSEIEKLAQQLHALSS